jgi:hypothetical protein
MEKFSFVIAATNQFRRTGKDNADDEDKIF